MLFRSAPPRKELETRGGAAVLMRALPLLPAGVIGAKLHGDLVTLQMSDPTDLRLSVPLRIDGEDATVHYINSGVPHVVVPVARVDVVHVCTQGAAIRRHEMFSPKGANVNFLERRADRKSVV